MKKYRGYIGQIMVSSNYRHIVYGEVRGFVSEYRSAEAAQRSTERDARQCASLECGAYSDAYSMTFTTED